MLATALIINMSFMRMFPVHINKFTNRFNWLSGTKKLEASLQLELQNDRITCSTETDRFSNIKCFNKLANTADVTDITFSHIIGTDRITNSWSYRHFVQLHYWNEKLSLLALQTLRLAALLEQRGLLTFNGLANWLTLLALQTLHLVALLERRGLLTFNGLMSWLTLLALQTLRLNVLLEQTGLLTFNGLTWSLTSVNEVYMDTNKFRITSRLNLIKTWLLTLDKICWQALDKAGKLCSFNEKEIEDWTFYLVISLYDMLLLVEERLIWLYCEAVVNIIDLVSLALPCSMMCSKSL